MYLMYLVDDYSPYTFNLLDTYFHNYIFIEAQGIFIHRLSLTILPTRNAPSNAGRKPGARGEGSGRSMCQKTREKSNSLQHPLEPGFKGKPSQRD